MKQDSNGKPLVLLISWLGGNPKHLQNICKLYTNLDFDVLEVRVQPIQLMRPVHKAQPIASDIVNFLAHNKNYERVVVHGFSIGGYLWGECLNHLQNDLDKRKVITEKVKAQIWDSMVGVSELGGGVGKTLFPTNPLMQRLIINLAQFYLQSFYNVSTKHYRKASASFYIHAFRAPALVFCSKTDQIGTEKLSLSIRDSFAADDIEVTLKCFNDSPHIQHFRRHHDEYTKFLLRHLKSCDLIES